MGFGLGCKTGKTDWLEKGWAGVKFQVLTVLSTSPPPPAPSVALSYLEFAYVALGVCNYAHIFVHKTPAS